MSRDDQFRWRNELDYLEAEKEYETLLQNVSVEDFDFDEVQRLFLKDPKAGSVCLARATGCKTEYALNLLHRLYSTD